MAKTRNARFSKREVGGLLNNLQRNLVHLIGPLPQKQRLRTKSWHWNNLHAENIYSTAHSISLIGKTPKLQLVQIEKAIEGFIFPPPTSGKPP